MTPEATLATTSGFALEKAETPMNLVLRSVFWRARYLRASDFLCHVPFLFWLIETTGADCVVTVGATDGVAHFAACQAVDRLRTDGRCVLVSDWTADDGKVPASLATYGTDTYSEVSQVVTASPAKGLASFEPAEIDVLLLDLEQPAEAIEVILRDGMSRLSDRAVIVLHGVRDEKFQTEEGRAVLARLQERFSMFTLDQGRGVAVLLAGENPDRRLGILTSLRRGDPELVDLRRIFRRLGEAHQFEFRSRDLSGQIDRTQDRLSQLSEDLHIRTQAHDERHRQVANLQSRNHDLMLAAAGAEQARSLAEATVAERDDLIVRADALQTEVARLNVLVATLTDGANAAGKGHQDAMNHQRRQHDDCTAAFAADRQVRFTEIAALTREVERVEALLVQERGRAGQMQAERDAATSKIAEFVSSTSWRLTRPARRMTDFWRSFR